ncbi:uncharacterized protein LOC105768641 [Gossypium raimondii]|uniref:uncharacterized protein LOC105768641 n=1 Tax=Gossypium raimondii TaxID=29730 RepID=UPI00227BDA9C|nr:uncharacterized protein LOC105768641 [Gossypium raimondii]
MGLPDLGHHNHLEILEGLIVGLFNLEQDYSRPRLKYSSTPLTKRPSSPPSSSSSPKTPSPFADGTHSKATRKSSPIPINCSRAPRYDKPFNVKIPGDGFLYSELWRIYALNSTFVFLPFHLCFGVVCLDGTVSWFLDRPERIQRHYIVIFSTVSVFGIFGIPCFISGGRGQDMKYDRESSGGRGGSKDKIDALGRLLTRILRHMATELNLNMRSDGYVKVEDLLKLNMRTFANIPLRSQTVDDIKEAVRKDNKQRFSLLEENGELLIRANQGHTVMTVESERLLKQILSADEVQFCVHGTYKRNLESILESGLKRMKRLHVHFSSGLPTDGEVISGMR